VLAKKTSVRALLLRLEFQICLSTGADCNICGLEIKIWSIKYFLSSSFVLLIIKYFLCCNHKIKQ